MLRRLDDEKAQEIVFIDLKDKSAFTDALVIASGRSQRHVAAMADRLLRALKDAGFGKAAVEGLPHADWVLIDAGDVIVHLFRPEVRSYYNIEKIWSVDLAAHSRRRLKISLLCVGRLGAGPEADLAADYARRATAAGRSLGLGPVRVVEVEARGRGKRVEGEALLARMDGAYSVACDEHGQGLTSRAFAALLARLRDEGVRHLAFAVGGADGLDEAVRNAARVELSLGPQTWPHALARAMLAEQVYRVTQILAGTPYHRD